MRINNVSQNIVLTILDSYIKDKIAKGQSMNQPSYVVT